MATAQAWTSSSTTCDGYISGGLISAVNGTAWAADTELMRVLALEQPRIVPRVSHHSSLAAEASIHEEPGAGKPHAGICAGLSGNWQSYRDQLSFDANDRNVQSLSTVA